MARKRSYDAIVIIGASTTVSRRRYDHSSMIPIVTAISRPDEFGTNDLVNEMVAVPMRVRNSAARL